jgi:hypothetical protein
MNNGDAVNKVAIDSYLIILCWRVFKNYYKDEYIFYER